MKVRTLEQVQADVDAAMDVMVRQFPDLTEEDVPGVFEAQYPALAEELGEALVRWELQKVVDGRKALDRLNPAEVLAN
ncbi:MAG: hypothetical protein ACXW3X_07680 [Rhodoplanes sp.]